ncbi:MAG: tetratricopeptide repeat protein [Thermodesulfobacteriota bacterium]
MNKISSSIHTSLLPLSIIVLLTVVAYSNTFSNSFHFDDRYAIFEDRAIRDLGNVPGIFGNILKRPVLRITFALNYYFGGTDVLGYHLVNLMMHIIAGIGVYYLAKLLSDKVVRDDKHSISFPLISSLIFTLHPNQTGAVTYIASRSAVFATLFYVLSLVLFIKHFEEKGWRRNILYLGAILSLVLGLGVKVTVLTLPFIIVLFCVYLTMTKGERFNIRHIVISIPWLLVLPLYAFIRRTMAGHVVPVDARFIGTKDILAPYQYFLTELNVVIFEYGRWLLFPIGAPNVDPDIPAETTILDGSTILAVIIIISLICFAIRFTRKAPIVSLSIFWYFITLIPTSTIFPLADVAVERHLYLPSIGFSFLAAFLLCHIQKKLPSHLAFVPYVPVIILIPLTIQSNALWRSEVTLWEHAAKKSPNKVRVLSNRAFAYLEAGDIDKAETLHLEFLRRFPGDSFGHNNLGLIYEKKGDYSAAVKYFKEAVKLRPRYWRFHMHLGNVYGKLDMIDKAADELEIAMDLKPSQPEPIIILATILAKQGKFDGVITLAERILSLESNNAIAFSLLGLAYEKKGMIDEAVTAYSKALEISPDVEELRKKLETLNR